MKKKPTSPAHSWRLQHRVADLCATSETQLVTATEDGTVRLWDMRYGNSPLMSVTFDGSPLTAMSHSPSGSVCAVATAQGLYTIDLGKGAGNTSCIAAPGSFRSGGTPARLGWNTTTMELLVSLQDGRISAYSPE